MGDWLDDEIDSLRKVDERRRQEQQLQQHRANILQAKAPGLFNEVKSSLESAIKRHNIAFQSMTGRILELEKGARDTTVLVKSKHATAALVVSLKIDSQEITISPRSGTRVDIPQPSIKLVVDQHDNVFAEASDGNDAEAVARAVMRPLYESFKQEKN